MSALGSLLVEAGRAGVGGGGRRGNSLPSLSIDWYSIYCILLLVKLTDQFRMAIRRSVASQTAIARAAQIDPAALSRFLSGDSCLGLDAMDRTVYLHIDSAEYADKTPNRVYRRFGIDNPSYKAK